MFALKKEIINRINRIRRAAQDAARNSFNRTAFLIRRSAVESVERAEGPSAPGTPVHTHRGTWFRRALYYDAYKDGAVIGPRYSYVHDVGATHEFGESIGRTKYPKRPTMGPALEKNLDVFANSWSGSIGE